MVWQAINEDARCSEDGGWGKRVMVVKGVWDDETRTAVSGSLRHYKMAITLVALGKVGR